MGNGSITKGGKYTRNRELDLFSATITYGVQIETPAQLFIRKLVFITSFSTIQVQYPNGVYELQIPNTKRDQNTLL